jgi:hypothetical protein
VGRGNTILNRRPVPVPKVKLAQDAKAEWKRNADEFELIRGREVRYGAIIALRHEGSGRFLAISQQSSEHNRDARKVVLAADVGDGMFIRLMPQLSRVHSEGERIRDGDPVQLESVSHAGMKLFVSRKELRSKTDPPWLEILASVDLTPFKVQRFRTGVADTKGVLTTRPTLVGGQAVRLLHVEANAYGECRADSMHTVCSQVTPGVLPSLDRSPG